jgi:hypothetical protein
MGADPPAGRLLVQTKASDKADGVLKRADVLHDEAGLLRAQQFKGFGDCALRGRDVIKLERVACFIETALGALNVTFQGAGAGIDLDRVPDAGAGFVDCLLRCDVVAHRMAG